MIAIVSSTIAPSATPSHDGARTTFSAAERLTHTRETVASLVAAGVSDILIADNSPGGLEPAWHAALAPARLHSFPAPPFRNKGIGEMWLLLSALPLLPADRPILKLSGRYRVAPDSPLLAEPSADVTGRAYGSGRRAELSTRAYVLRDRSVAERLWPRTLDEIYARSARIAGPRSLLRLLAASLRPARDDHIYSDPPGSVELAIRDAIRHLGLSLRACEKIHVDGILGSWINPPVAE